MRTRRHLSFGLTTLLGLAALAAVLSWVAATTGRHRQRTEAWALPMQVELEHSGERDFKERMGALFPGYRPPARGLFFQGRYSEPIGFEPARGDSDDERLDIEQLQHFRQLRKLRISNYRLANVAAFSKLKQLRQLELIHTDIADLSGVGSLSQLRHLVIRGGPCRDLSPLARLVRLRSLEVSYLDVDETPGLGNLSELRELTFDATSIESVDSLQTSTQLRRLGLSLTSVKRVPELPNLEELDLSGSEITDPSSLSKLAQLRRLDLSETEVVDIGPLTTLKQLASLRLYATEVEDGQPLAELPHLNKLDLRKSPLYDLAFLSKCRALRNLSISDCDRLSDLAKAHNLRRVNLGPIIMDDPLVLRNCKRLEFLMVNGHLDKGVKQKLRLALPGCEIVTQW